MEKNKKTAAFWGKRATALSILGTIIIISAHLSPSTEDTKILLSLPGIAIGLFGANLYMPYWKCLDEAAQEAHKYAWFYGGGIALIGLMIVVGFIFGFNAGYSGTDLIDSAKSIVTNAYIQGGALVIFAQFFGYLVTWIFWWRVRT